MFVEIVLFFAILIFLLVLNNKKPNGLPPGQWGWPIIGCLKPGAFNYVDFFENMSKKHGNICSTKFGQRIVISLADYNVIKAGFAKPELSGRPDLFTFRIFRQFLNLGIIGSDGDVWLENRRFALRHLRDFGLGRSSMEGIIEEEVEAFIQYLHKNSNKPFSLDYSLNVAILNVIWKLVADIRYETDDQEIQRFTKMITSDFAIITGYVAILDFFPSLINVVPTFIKNKVMKVNTLQQSTEEMTTYFRKIINEHAETLDPQNPRDYIDTYLIEMEKHKHEPNEIYDSNYMNLVSNIFDIFTAGSETTSSTIRWFVLHMALHPEIQRKAQEEIDSVVSKDRFPSFNDRDKLPYLEAVMHELNRFVSLVPSGVVHAATEDTELMGYLIPKGAMILGLLKSCHRNPKFWSHPDEFYPEHFLDKDGKFVMPKEGYAPFSIGKRVCLGESVAKMELFLFTSALLQQFEMKPPHGIKLTDENNPEMIIVRQPMPYKIILKPRYK